MAFSSFVFKQIISYSAVQRSLVPFNCLFKAYLEYPNMNRFSILSLSLAALISTTPAMAQGMPDLTTPPGADLTAPAPIPMEQEQQPAPDASIVPAIPAADAAPVVPDTVPAVIDPATTPDTLPAVTTETPAAPAADAVQAAPEAEKAVAPVVKKHTPKKKKKKKAIHKVMSTPAAEAPVTAPRTLPVANGIVLPSGIRVGGQ